MSDMVNLCAKIPRELHSKIKSYQVDSGMTLNEFMEYFILNYFEMETKIEKKGVNNMATRTLAVQIDDELFERINEFIKRKGLKKKEFLIDLIETALAEDEETTEEVELTDDEETTEENEDNFDDEVESTEDAETTDENEDNFDDQVESTDESDNEITNDDEESQGDSNTIRDIINNY